MGSSGVRDFLRLFRAQTAAVEGAGFPLAAWIGGAPLWTLPLFAVLGIVAHFAGFGMNGITDLAYDRLDPSKADHPLVAGRITRPTAVRTVVWLSVIGVMLFLALVYLGAATRSGILLPLRAWAGYVLLGAAYNLVGKAWKPGAVIEISGAFALAFLACGSAWTGHASLLVWTVAAYAFLFTAYQIALAGELKEIGQGNEKNILRRLGSRVGPGLLGAAVPALGEMSPDAAPPFFLPGQATPGLGFALSFLKCIALLAVALLVGGEVFGLVVFTVAFVVLTIYNVALLRPGPFDRNTRVRLMGIGEAGSYLLLVCALAPVLWPWLLLAFLILPVLWFAGMNRALWARTGSAWAPGV